MFDPDWSGDEVMSRFNEELLPWLRRYGPYVGERAMQGDELATSLIRRYNVFLAWQDPVNYSLLGNLIKEYEKTRMNN